METPSGSSNDRLRTAELLAMARRTEPNTSERTLEFWRHQDLLPHAERTGQEGSRPVWTYPAAAADQLCALLHLRQATKDPDLLRAALWFDGYPVPTSRAQDSMTRCLHRLQVDLQKQLARRRTGTRQQGGQDRGDVLAEVARDLAVQRRTPIPRFGRQSLAARQQAFETILRLGLGEELTPGQLDHTGAAVERVMGIDQARRYRSSGAQPWLTGPPAESLALVHEMGSLPHVTGTLESADDRDLEAARPLARTLLTGISAFSLMADAFVGYPNASGLGAAPFLSDSPLIRVMVLAWAISITRSPVLATNLAEISGALTDSILPIRAAARELAAIPEPELAERLRNLPPRDQNRLKRLIDVFKEPPATT
jgi:hypothetical protein